VIARVAPMLGMLPDIQDAPTINQALFIPLQPGRPVGVAARGPQTTAAPASSSRPALTVPVTPLAPARPIARDQRHEASVSAPRVVAADVLPTAATAHSVAAR
jgi:cell division protein FtsI (penicillin-binding protein 3)